MIFHAFPETKGHVCRCRVYPRFQIKPWCMIVPVHRKNMPKTYRKCWVPTTTIWHDLFCWEKSHTQTLTWMVVCYILLIFSMRNNSSSQRDCPRFFRGQRVTPPLAAWHQTTWCCTSLGANESIQNIQTSMALPASAIQTSMALPASARGLLRGFLRGFLIFLALLGGWTGENFHHLFQDLLGGCCVQGRYPRAAGVPSVKSMWNGLPRSETWDSEQVTRVFPHIYFGVA